MTPLPQISVVMPCYNIRRFLAPAVESILTQTFGDFEFLIVEGGSTDGSREIIQGYGDPRIRIVDYPARKDVYEWFVGALNEGVAQAKAPLIARMDGDDVSLPLRFERQMQVFGEHPELVALGCGMDFITESGATSNRRLNGELQVSRREGDVILAPPLPHGSVTFKKDAFIKAGGYRNQLLRCEDSDLWLRMAETGTVALLKERLFLYRINLMSIISTVNTRHEHYGAMVRAFSVERLTRGSDPIQRGEALPQAPAATKADARWEASMRNSLVASIEKRHAAAMLLALRAVAICPRRLRGLKRLAGAALGRYEA